MWWKAYAVAITSLLSGAAVVHNIMRPDLTIPVGKQAREEPSDEAL